MNQFWHDIVTDKSFLTLQSLRREFDFTVIGGWAVFLYTKTLKSKDIDIIVDFETLAKFKTQFDVIKNERLKKYEIKFDGFDLDIYVVSWSELGLPADYILKTSVSLAGFKVPAKEVLVVLKLFTHKQRKGSLKGKKDAIDIISLLARDSINFEKFNEVIGEFGLYYLKQELEGIFNSTIKVEELELNQKSFSDLKKKILKS